MFETYCFFFVWFNGIGFEIKVQSLVIGFIFEGMYVCCKVRFIRSVCYLEFKIYLSQ